MKRIIPIIILLAALGGWYWQSNQPKMATLAEIKSTALTGSGSIEAETVNIIAELGGRIIKIKVGEGAEVKAGQLLIELDKTELLAKKVQLEATVATARANLLLTKAKARAEDIAVAQAQLTQAETARDGAKAIWEARKAAMNNPYELKAQVSQAKAGVTEANKNLEMARVILKRAEITAEAASRNQSNNVGLAQNKAAGHRLEAAQIRVKMAETAVEGSKTQVEHLIGMRDHPLALITQANAARAAHIQAEAAILVAKANLDAVKANPTREDIDIATAQLIEAKTALSAIEVQLAKQKLTAPRDGLISKKLVNPGELAAPGSTLLELSAINNVDLIVYIPETKIGQVGIGQKAQVYVDAYDNEQFEGKVTFIAPEAEFTPRNVQTKEERVSLVFAVKINLDNAAHRLKPGMPADAEIMPVDN